MPLVLLARVVPELVALEDHGHGFSVLFLARPNKTLFCRLYLYLYDLGHLQHLATLGVLGSIPLLNIRTRDADVGMFHCSSSSSSSCSSSSTSTSTQHAGYWSCHS